MIGIVVTGHGTFASGMTSALKLICGDLELCRAVDFTSFEGTAEIEAGLAESFDAFEKCEGVLVFSDLVGGTPFKTAVMLGNPRGNVRVIAGTNLGTLIETYMARADEKDVDELARLAVETAKSQVLLFEDVPGTSSEPDISEDGI